jgi:hypothetical protein
MEQNEANAIYKKIKFNSIVYEETIHCPMIIKAMVNNSRYTSFCKEALISERTFLNWTYRHPVFRECYELGKVFARENWEDEAINNKNNVDWDSKEWGSRGARYFSVNKDKIRIMVDAEMNPWEQYQKIMSDCASGDFTASEIKQVMESINVGRNAFESFKLQQDVDKMAKEINQMSQHNGHNIIPIGAAEK